MEMEIEWIPQTREEFNGVINDAPWWVLKDMGFVRYGSINDVLMNLRASGERSTGDYVNEGMELVLFPKSFESIIPDKFVVMDIFCIQSTYDVLRDGNHVYMNNHVDSCPFGIVKNKEFFR